MAKIKLATQECPAMHGINNLIQVAKAIKAFNSRMMTRKQYECGMRFFRRMRWLLKNNLMPVNSRTDKQLAENLA